MKGINESVREKSGIEETDESREITSIYQQRHT